MDCKNQRLKTSKGTEMYDQVQPETVRLYFGIRRIGRANTEVRYYREDVL